MTRLIRVWLGWAATSSVANASGAIEEIQGGHLDGSNFKKVGKLPANGAHTRFPTGGEVGPRGKGTYGTGTFILTL